LHDKALITEVDYMNNEFISTFASKMMKGPGEFFTESFKEKALKDWIEYQKTTSQFADSYLNTATTLNYYWFSLGPIALGISTYHPLNEEDANLFKRFLKVFELSYRRYLDIEKAEAQAREARIEASLEHMRAAAMSMRKPEDVIFVCEAMFRQLSLLGFTNIRNAQAAIKNDKSQSYLISTYSDYEAIVLKEAPYKRSPIVEELYNELGKSSDAFFQKQFSGEKIDEWRKWRNSLSELKDIREVTATSMCFYLFSIGEGHLGISTFDPITDEQVEILKRFKNVFELSYQRFTDVAKAEAQAREAQIELALERVRARTMAMQKSEELAETSFVLFQQFKDLGATSEQISIGIFNEEENVMELYSTVHGTQWKEAAKVDLDEPVVMKKIKKAWKEQKKSLVIDLTGNDLQAYNDYRKKLSDIEFREDRWVIHIACFSKGVLTFSTAEPYPHETIELLERFAGVFDGTYTRFLDLKKAEAHAREARIEAALERVRSRSMAMRKTEELFEAAEFVFKELTALGIESMNVSYCFMDEDEKSAQYYSVNPVDGKVVSFPMIYPHTETDVMRSILSSWKKQEPFNVIDLDEQSTLTHQTWVGEHILNMITQRNIDIPFSVEAFLSISPKTAMIYTFNFIQGYVFVIREERLTEKQEEILLRFTKVFEMTYRRFLDIKLAEAHAEKAQIEEQKLREEKKRSDSLLLNILPEEIANELKQFGKSYARNHAEVTIFFADIKGFSSIAENLSAEELVMQLDECFRAFDKIIEKHGLEKIKTLGDAYICACGLPTPVHENAIKTVNAAIDMLDFLKGFNISKKIQDLPAFEFRVGIHTGPVVTGVVGLKKFTYDIWGDTVNMAARMEQHGEPGRINISENTYELIKNKFTCTPRGKIQAKNKGEIDMYFVER
jgi:class 3 adenylate cyclase